MQPTSIDIEQIIRVVMQRLAAADDLMHGVSAIADTQEIAADLVLHEQLITLGSIAGKLNGKSRLRVPERAVVTPAVIDELKRYKVELVRAEAATKHRLVNSNTTSLRETKSIARSAPILVCGSAAWFNSLTRHLCPKQAFVRGCDDGVVAEVIQKHKMRGGTHVVWISPTPYAASVTAYRDIGCTSVMLPSLSDLKAALEQAEPECVIVDASRFTVAAIGNLVRAMFKHLRSTGQG